MQKKVLALGVKAEQLAGIKYAKSKGLYVIGIDKEICKEFRPYLDEYYEIDLKNESAIIKKVKNMDISFIIPSTIGHLLTTIGAVNDALKLPGVSKKWAINLTDKEKYNSLLASKGLYTPPKIIIRNPNYMGVKKAIFDLGLPIILKPIKGSGSRGIISIVEIKDVEEAINYALSNLQESEGIIVERFIEGQEYGVDFSIIGGKLEIIAVREKLVTKLPYRQEIGYISEFDLNIKNRIAENLNCLFKDNTDELASLGHIDVLINDKFTYFLELSLRPAGLGITSNLLPYMIGYNPIENLIDYFLNGKMKKSNSPLLKKYIGLFLWDLPEGIIARIPEISDIKTLKYKLNLVENMQISKVKTGFDIFNRGYFVIEAEAKEKLLKARENLLKEIKVSGDKSLINIDESNNNAWSNEIRKNVMLYPNERVVAFLAKNYKDIVGNRSKKALDIGFGSGRHLKLLMDYGFQTYGTDYSRDCLDIAKKNLGNNSLLKELHAKPFEKLEFSDETFDTIIFYGLAFFRPLNEMKKDLDYIYKLLKKSGKVIVNFRSIEDSLYGKGEEIEKNTFILDDSFKDFENMIYTFLSLEEAKELVESIGFNIINIEREDYWKNNLEQRNSWFIFTLEKPS